MSTPDPDEGWEPREGPEYAESGPALEPEQVEAKAKAAAEEAKASAKSSKE